MSKGLYKFGGGARQLRCQELDSFLHTLNSRSAQHFDTPTSMKRSMGNP